MGITLAEPTVRRYPAGMILAGVGLFLVAAPMPFQAQNAPTYDPQKVRGWDLKVHRELYNKMPKQTARAIELLEKQLREVEKVVPKAAVAKLKQVTLWFSPEYPGSGPGAAYHPSVDWLKQNGRNPDMAKCVEFTNIRIFEAETRRMPNFALHELAHAYHDRFLPDGFGNKEIAAQYEVAKTSGTYDKVDRRDSEGRVTQDKAYGMNNPMEYFAETSEAFFSTNDFYPFVNAELKKHDPKMFELLGKLWSNP